MFIEFYNVITTIPEGANIKAVVVTLMILLLVFTVGFLCFSTFFRRGSLKILLQNLAMSLLSSIYVIFTFLWDLCFYPSWKRYVPSLILLSTLTLRFILWISSARVRSKIKQSVLELRRKKNEKANEENYK